MNEEKHLDEMLTIDEVAKRFKVRKSWLYERTRTGAIPVRRLGRQLRFSARELDEWARSQR